MRKNRQHILLLVFTLFALPGCKQTDNGHIENKIVTPNRTHVSSDSCDKSVMAKDSIKDLIWASRRDSLLVDSMIVLCCENFERLNNRRINLVKAYLLYCRNQDGSEGIYDTFMHAFTHNDECYRLFMTEYRKSNKQEQMHLIKALNTGLWLYLDTWASSNNLNIDFDNSYDEWVNNLALNDILRIRNYIKNNETDFIKRFVRK